jgi:hypothetical protein
MAANDREGVLKFGEPLDDEKLMDHFAECLDASQGYFEKIWEEYGILSDMYGGETLSDRDKNYLIETLRPPISFNFAAGMIDTLVGEDIEQRKEVVFRAQDFEESEDAISDALTRIVRSQVQKCKGHRADSDAYQNMLIGGYGFTEHYLDVSRVPIRVVRASIPPPEMWPDPDFIEGNGEDAQFWIREREWALEEAEAMWPDKADELRSSYSPIGVRSLPMPRGGKPSSVVKRKNAVRIYEFQYRRTEPMVYYIDPRDETAHNDPLGALSKVNDELSQVMHTGESGDPVIGIDGQPMPKYPDGVGSVHHYKGKRWYRAFLAADGPASPRDRRSGEAGIVLEHRPLSVRGSTIRCITGLKWYKVTERRARFFGPARLIHDAQLYINRSAAVTLEILQRGAKGGGLLEQGALLSSLDDFVKNTSKPGNWTEVAASAITEGKIKPLDSQEMPQAITQFLQMCIDLHTKLSGVSDYMKGTQAGDRSSATASNQEERSMRMLGPIFEPLVDFKKEEGLLMADLARRHLPIADLDKILGPTDPVEGLTVQSQPDPQNQGQQTQQPIPSKLHPERPITMGEILKDVDPLDYEVAVDAQDASPSVKAAAFRQWTVTDLVGTCEKAGFGDIVIPEVVRMSPLPGTIADKLADEMKAQVDEKKSAATEQGAEEWLKSTPPDQIEMVMKRNGIKLPDRTKPLSENLALDKLYPLLTYNEQVQVLQQLGITPDPQRQGMPHVPGPPGAPAPQGGPYMPEGQQQTLAQLAMTRMRQPPMPPGGAAPQ